MLLPKTNLKKKIHKKKFAERTNICGKRPQNSRFPTARRIVFCEWCCTLIPSQPPAAAAALTEEATTGSSSYIRISFQETEEK